jgi:hypothetical protein
VKTNRSGNTQAQTHRPTTPELAGLKTGRNGHGKTESYHPTIQGLTGLLDYAILEGTELRRPLFVFLLRLARLALLEEEGASFQPIDFMQCNDEQH